MGSPGSLRGAAHLRKAGRLGIRWTARLRPHHLRPIAEASVPAAWLRAPARAFRPIRCWKARSPSPGWPSWPRRTASRRWRSPTPTICSGRSNSPRRWRARHPADRRLRAGGRFRRRRTREPRRRPGAGRGRASCSWPRARTGYRSLMRLSSRAFLETPPNEQPHIELAWLDGAIDGLIALTGGPGGPLDRRDRAGQGGLAAARCEELEGCSATGSTSSCSATARRPSAR